MANEGTAIEEREAQFWGTHGHSLDSKGRVILPSRFREPFRQGAFITKMSEGCLGVWTPKQFDLQTVAVLDQARQGHQAARNVARVWAAGTFDTTPDGQGRLAIPPQLRAYAALEPDTEVVVNGAINHVEIWSGQRWNDVDTEGSQFLRSGTDDIDQIGF